MDNLLISQGKKMQKQPIALVGLEWDVVDLVDSLPQYNLLGFIDPAPSYLDSFAHLGNDDDWPKLKQEIPHLKAVFCIDDPKIKPCLVIHYGKDDFLSLISPNAHVSRRAIIGCGAILQRGVCIMPHAKIGNFCKINVNATVHHEAKVADYCTLAPGAQILGRVVLEEGVYVGAGAIIRQRCKVGAGALIGAGAVVVSDIPPNTVVVGIPAKERKTASFL